MYQLNVKLVIKITELCFSSLNISILFVYFSYLLKYFFTKSTNSAFLIGFER